MKPYMMMLWLLCSTVGHAQWSEPGQPFTGALQWEGEVTDHRNPWRWHIGYDGAPISVSLADGQEGRWRGLLEAMPLVLGKTEHTLLSGREGVLPLVSFGRGTTGITVSQEGNGVQEIHLPVREDSPDGVQVGTLRLRVQSLAALHAKEQGAMLTGEALTVGAPQHLRTQLQTLFGHEAPAWLASDSGLWAQRPLTALAEPGLTELDAVYAVQVVAGSGELQLQPDNIPTRWKATLPVNIEYQ
ncbi:hypothetical protein RA180_21520 [Aeromonas salmonicida]|uniref:F4 family fimbrial subunit n=1 Tax=Aeromonas salmonicida TaxID=645 RepID=UPI002796D3BD|nr:hypothetical protein [Aeromonas salmonicida]MDQ1886572.1 hypothetical protein [Aeromonas salmonicida]